MMEKENESREFELVVESSPTHKSGYKTADILKKNSNMVPNSALSMSSVNPIEHNYARELDIRLDASNKQSLTALHELESTSNLEPINKRFSKLNEIHIKKNLSRADVLSKPNPY